MYSARHITGDFIMNTTPEWEDLVQRYMEGSIQADELAALQGLLCEQLA